MRYLVITWRERIEITWHKINRRTVCRVVGHNWSIRKLHDDLCSRCYVARPANSFLT